MECGVEYAGIRRVKYVQRDLEDIAQHSATYVDHQFDEQDLRAYYETMRQIVSATREVGLGVWLDPVGLGYVLGGDDFLSDWALWHPEAAQVDQFGRMLPGACPNQPAFRDFVRAWTDKAVDLGPDGILWDEPHLYQGVWYDQPERWACRCELCQALYRERNGEAMPLDGNDPGVLAFQADSLLHLLTEAMAYAHSQGVLNGTCLLPREMQRPGSLDWEAVAAIPHLNNLGTDPYPFPAFPNQASQAHRWREMVTGYATEVAALCQRHGIDNHLAVQAFSLPKDDSGYLDGVWDVALAAGITNLYAWGFDGHRDMSQFACADPDAVWAKIGQGFHRARGLAAQGAN